MGAQKGKDLLLKIDADGTGDFRAVAGLRSRRLAFNADMVDITDSDSLGRWRELLAGSGVKRASLGGSGIFRDGQSDALIRTHFFNGEISAWEIAIPDFGVVSGPFQIMALEYGGNHDGEMTFEMAMESAGELTFAEA